MHRADSVLFDHLGGRPKSVIVEIDHELDFRRARAPYHLEHTYQLCIGLGPAELDNRTLASRHDPFGSRRISLYEPKLMRHQDSSLSSVFAVYRRNPLKRGHAHWDAKCIVAKRFMLRLLYTGEAIPDSGVVRGW
jgi:hypothetical protein